MSIHRPCELVLLAVGLLSVAAPTARATPVTLDFNEAGQGPFDPNFFADRGVVFSPGFTLWASSPVTKPWFQLALEIPRNSLIRSWAPSQTLTFRPSQSTSRLASNSWAIFGSRRLNRDHNSIALTMVQLKFDPVRSRLHRSWLCPG